jgi:hypothetical protein
LISRQEFAQKRESFDILNQSILDIHAKQHINLIASHERKLQSDKSLNALESQHLKDEVRVSMAKKFRIIENLTIDVRQSFQLTINKRINDQLREYQLMELRHVKERFEVQLTGFEEMGVLLNRHSTQLANMRARHVSEHHSEKEFLRNTHESNVLQKLLKQHARALKRLSLDNRIAARQLKAKQGKRYIMKLI